MEEGREGENVTVVVLFEPLGANECVFELPFGLGEDGGDGNGGTKCAGSFPRALTDMPARCL